MMKNNYIKQKRKDQNPVNHWKIFEGRLVFLLAMVILFVVAYTFILQQAYTQTALKTEIERDISSADAVHKLVNDRLGRKDFNEIKSKADENTELFKNISTYMNEIRTLNSTRYIYTATRNEDGRLQLNLLLNRESYMIKYWRSCMRFSLRFIVRIIQNS